MFTKPVIEPTDIQEEWEIRVSLLAGEYCDNNLRFGTTKHAASGLDAFDLRKPRALSAPIAIYFNRPDWDPDYNTFTSDFRPLFVDKDCWELEVYDEQRLLTKLSFSGIENIPEEFEVYLIDKANVKYINLRDDSTYFFKAMTSVSKFSVLVGQGIFLQDDLKSVVPKEFALRQNFPNPFNPITTISFDVPYHSQIILKIYNIRGEEVKTIINDQLEAGRYRFDWQGRNNAGNQVSSGVYLYRLITQTGLTFSGKMVLMK